MYDDDGCVSQLLGNMCVYIVWVLRLCVCVCGLDERVRSSRDCVRWRQFAFDDRQYFPDSTAGASIFGSISPVAAFDCPFGQLVGGFHSARTNYANSRSSRSYPPQGETAHRPSYVYVVLIVSPGAIRPRCVCNRILFSNDDRLCNQHPARRNGCAHFDNRFPVAGHLPAKYFICL